MDQGIQAKDPGGRDRGEMSVADKLCAFVLDIPDAYWV